MKKTVWGGIVVVVLLLLGGYALWSASRSAQQTPVTTDQNGQTSIPSETINPNATGDASQDNGIGDSSSPSDNTTAAYKDGTYTGSVGSAAPYGQVQVSVTISGGKIASIQMLEKPQGPGETNEISARAFPILIKEAITAQNAKVHIVSGATQDSEGFQASLSSALQQAQS